MKCVLSLPLQLLSETFLILRRSEQDRIKHVYWSSCKMAAILVRFKYTLYFLDSFTKNTHISDFIKICPVGAELFHEYGRTDMTKVTDAFRSFANASKKDSSRTYIVSNWKTNWIYVSSNHKIQNNFRNWFKTNTIKDSCGDIEKLGVTKMLLPDTTNTVNLQPVQLSR
jgi:hypothetical protein